MTVRVDVDGAVPQGEYEFDAGAGMTALRLRTEAAELRAKSEDAAARKTQVALAMVRAIGPAHMSLELEQGVADCMMRRYRQWANQLELAARELEDP